MVLFHQCFDIDLMYQRSSAGLKHDMAWIGKLQSLLQSSERSHAGTLLLLQCNTQSKIVIKLSQRLLLKMWDAPACFTMYGNWKSPSLLCSDQQWRWPRRVEREMGRWLQRGGEPLLVDGQWGHPDAVGWVWFQTSQVRAVLGVCSRHVHR